MSDNEAIKQPYVTSDESSNVPADQDNGFVGEVTVNLVFRFTTHSQYSCTNVEKPASELLFAIIDVVFIWLY